MALLVQGIPEQTALVTLAFVIAGIPLQWRRILLIGVSLAFCAYVVRLFPIPFGIHTVFILFVLFIILIWLNKGDVARSFIASSSSMLALGVFEFGSMSLIMLISGFEIDTLFNNLVIRIAVGEPHVLLLFISAFLIKKLYITRVA